MPSLRYQLRYGQGAPERATQPPLYGIDQAGARSRRRCFGTYYVALRLTVISEQRGSLGRNASIVLGVGGGSIGRAHDNDWVLPDGHCYVSAHHARVQFRNGSYYLVDTSTNGVYVNGAASPINPRNIYPLRNGDYLRFGEYEIAVSIDVESSEAPEASSIFPVGAAAAGGPAQRADVDLDIDVQEFLQTAAGLSGPAPRGGSVRTGPVDAFGQPVGAEESQLPRARTARAAASATAPAAVGAAAQKLRRELRAASVEPTGRHRTLNAAPVEQTALEAFCRGAGLEPQRLPGETQSRVLYLAGLLLREALAGLKGLALAQRELRDQARLPVGREDPQHIGLTGLPVEDLMMRLLLGHERHDLDAVQWLRDLARGSRAFDLAVIRALPAALAEFIARLDPRSLAHQGGVPAADAESGSTGVTARFRSITESSPGALPQLFVEALARAFAAEAARGAPDQTRP
jgi:type VI secretion system protein